MLAGSGPPAVTGWPEAEVVPVEALLRWSAQVVEVGPAQSAGVSAGARHGPTRRGRAACAGDLGGTGSLQPGSGGEAIVQRSGVNLVREIPA